MRSARESLLEPQAALFSNRGCSQLKPHGALCEKRGALLLEPRVLSVRTAGRLSVTTGDLSARCVCSLGSDKDGSDAAIPRRPSNQTENSSEELSTRTP